MEIRKYWRNYTVPVTTGVVIGTAIFVAALKYHLWRNEHIQLKPNVVAPRNFDEHSTTNANEVLLNFPDSIPGAARVTKYITHDARYCLVHIRQVHKTESPSDAEREEVKAVQSDIRSIINFLTEKGGFFEKIGYKIPINVYSEGVSEKNLDFKYELTKWLKDTINGRDEYRAKAAELRKRESIIKKDFENLEKKVESTNPNDPNYNELIRKKDRLEEQLYDCRCDRTSAEEIERDLSINIENRIYFGADTFLIMDGKINVLPAEDPKKFELALEVKDRDYKELQDKDHLVPPKFVFDNIILYDLREDNLFEYVSKRKDPLAICIFGGGHAFGGLHSFTKLYDYDKRESSMLWDELLKMDNIHKWNHLNPEKKFSLIEITPIHYKKT